MYEDRVMKGAALLDRVRPGWAEKVGTDRLAMETCDRCILGQLYGHYDRGWMCVLLTLSSSQFYSSADHGFTLKFDEQVLFNEPLDVILGRFRELADAWRAEIRKRASATSETPA